ncbi:MAG: methyl-accepting chemotaxis protein [Candidatus Omnitrophica bacterium]|nr:methyl-accepting chemotaxis protein [Candidatus Omnitrophota bacterium]
MNQAPAKGYRRRNYYIDKDFQTKFVLRFCALVGGGAVLIILGLCILTRLSTTVSIVKSRVVVMTTADFLFPLLVQTVVIVTIAVGILTAIFTLLVSHKIAGPLYRFKQSFRELSQGNFSSQVRLRKDDQLHEVATEFNQMINAVRNQVHEANLATQAIKKELDEIGEFNIEDQKRHRFTEIKLQVQELEKALRFFNT